MIGSDQIKKIMKYFLIMIKIRYFIFNIVKEDAIEALIESIQPAYEEAMHLTLTIYIASIENGTEVVG